MCNDENKKSHYEILHSVITVPDDREKLELRCTTTTIPYPRIPRHYFKLMAKYRFHVHKYTV